MLCQNRSDDELWAAPDFNNDKIRGMCTLYYWNTTVSYVIYKKIKITQQQDSAVIALLSENVIPVVRQIWHGTLISSPKLTLTFLDVVYSDLCGRICNYPFVREWGVLSSAIVMLTVREYFIPALAMGFLQQEEK